MVLNQRLRLHDDLTAAVNLLTSFVMPKLKLLDKVYQSRTQLRYSKLTLLPLGFEQLLFTNLKQKGRFRLKSLSIFYNIVV